MNFFLATLFLLTTAFISCVKENTPGTAEETLPNGTVLATGAFSSNAHPTSGSVKVIQNTEGKRFLVFENFRTDNGPDLDVWLSPNISGNPYQVAGDLKAVSGNFFYELGPGINFNTNNRVLIWCEDFSILFGNALLQ